MKKHLKHSCLVLMVLFSGYGLASDLLFKTGFENRYHISGEVSGLESTPLTLMLISVSGSEELVIQNNGPFVFELPVMAGHAWRVTLQSIPNHPQQQTCQLSNESGSALPTGGVDDVGVDCQIQPWHWDVMSWDQGGWN